MNYSYFLILALLFSCSNSPVVEDISSDKPVIMEDTTAPVLAPPVSMDLDHKYSYVKKLSDGSIMFGMLELYGDDQYTQVVMLNDFKQSGRGSYRVDGDKLILSRSSGVAVDGSVQILQDEERKYWLRLPNGVTYVQDDESTYIREAKPTPGSRQETSDITESSPKVENEFFAYEGSITDEFSGVDQFLVLKIRSDFSAASIGGGPFTSVEDQGDGSYLWVDGTIVGMRFKPMENSCNLYDAEGNFLGTLRRK